MWYFPLNFDIALTAYKKHPRHFRIGQTAPHSPAHSLTLSLFWLSGVPWEKDQVPEYFYTTSCDAGDMAFIMAFLSISCWALNTSLDVTSTITILTPLERTDVLGKVRILLFYFPLYIHLSSTSHISVFHYLCFWLLLICLFFFHKVKSWIT